MTTQFLRPTLFFFLLLPAAVLLGCRDEPRAVTENKVASYSTSAPSSAPSVPLKVGDRLPDLTLKNTQNQDVSIATLYARQPIVLTVYRGGWCPYCITSLKQWQDKLQQVTTLGAAVVAVSPESPEHVAETVGKGNLAYTVLSDSTGDAGRALGLAFTLDEKTQTKYKGYGIDLSKYNADGMWELPHPATYLVDTRGVIRYLYINEDYKQRADPDEIIAVLSKIGAAPGK